METAFNLGSLTVDSSGRASFSGLSSGIDFAGAVDGIIEAKRAPVVTLEDRITANTDKITALTDLSSLLQSLRNSVANIRGAVTVGGVGNTFNSKQTFASTSRSDGLTPSAAGNLLGVTVTNAAAAGTHTLEVRRVATAHKISSQSFSSTTTALGLSGSFRISGGTNEATVTVQTTDSLSDLLSRINNANTGATPTGVTASIVSVSSTQNFLLLTNDQTGTDIVLTDTGSVLSGLGLSTTNGTGGFRNGLPTGTADGQSKIEAADGFDKILFDGTQADNAFLISYDQATKVMTLTRGDGTTDTATLSSTAIAAGSTETVTFSNFGATVVLDSNFDKTADILVDADIASVTGGAGAIDSASIKISDSVGDISGIGATTLTFGSLATPAAITVTAGAFSGTFDGTSTGAKTVTLTDGAGNSLTTQFTVTSAFTGAETAASIDLQELENLVGATGTQFSTVLQKAQTARFTADGLLDPTRYESQVLASATGQINSQTSVTNTTGSFTVDGVVINYDASVDSLTDLANRITANVTGVTASVVADGNGFRMDLTTTNSAITLVDSSSLLADLGVNNERVIERASNAISDVFAGITLTLFQSEPGTDIKIDIEEDLSAVKTAITDFVTAYNDVRVFVNTQNQTDPATGTKGADSGPLFGDATMRTIRDQLSGIVGGGTTGVSSQFSVLAQIGVNFVNNGQQSDPLNFDTLEIDDTKLDSALLNNADDVRRLLAFDFSSSDPNVTLLDFTGTTAYSATGYQLNIGTIGAFDHNSSTITDRTATLDSATSAGATTSGSFTINGTLITYDVTTDSLNSLSSAINAAAIPGVTSQVLTDTSGAHIAIHSTTTPLSITGDTGDLLTKMPFTPDPNIIDSANIGGPADGSDDGSVTTDGGRVLTVTSQSGANGLKVLYTGAASTSGIQLDYTVGVAPRIFFAIDSMVDTTNGAIQAEIDGLDAQNTATTDRIDRIDTRLAILRESLSARFLAAEQALATMQSTLNSINQFFTALTKS